MSDTPGRKKPATVRISLPAKPVSVGEAKAYTVPQGVASQMPSRPKPPEIRISLPRGPDRQPAGHAVIPIPEETPLIEMVNQAINMCLTAGYRDIMFAAHDNNPVVVAGLSSESFDWVPVTTIVPKMRSFVLARLKVMANMSIAEHRRLMLGKIDVVLSPGSGATMFGAYFIPRGGGRYEFYLSKVPNI
ncbi:MAG: hypothetical protein WC250_03605 [Candidatus Paceibacterota bacterium]|jgi:hypothetical protein